MQVLLIVNCNLPRFIAMHFKYPVNKLKATIYQCNFTNHQEMLSRFFSLYIAKVS